MATRPTGATDYASSQAALVTTPLDAQIKTGFVVSQPSVHLLNGVFRRLFRWIEYLNGITIPDETGGISVTYNGRAIQLPFPLVGANDAAKIASAQIYKREEKTLSGGGTGVSLWAGSGAVMAGTAQTKTLTAPTHPDVRVPRSGRTQYGAYFVVFFNNSLRQAFTADGSDLRMQVLRSANSRAPVYYRHNPGFGNKYPAFSITFNSSGNIKYFDLDFESAIEGLDIRSIFAGKKIVVQQGAEYAVFTIPTLTQGSRFNRNPAGWYGNANSVFTYGTPTPITPDFKSSGFSLSASGSFTLRFAQSASETTSGGAGSRLTTSGALSLSNSPPFSLTNYQYTGGKIVLTFAAAVTATSFDSVTLARGTTTLLTLAAGDATFSSSAPFTASWTAPDVLVDGGTITFTFAKGGAGLAVAEWNVVASTETNFSIFVDAAGDNYLRIEAASGISNNDKLFIRRAPAA